MAKPRTTTRKKAAPAGAKPAKRAKSTTKKQPSIGVGGSWDALNADPPTVGGKKKSASRRSSSR